jgi:hypothetical protein
MRDLISKGEDMREMISEFECLLMVERKGQASWGTN